MNSEISISAWIAGAKEGDSQALQGLWAQYFPKLVALSRRRFQQQRPQVVDEEDVAISVMESFFRAAEAGRFPDLADRDDLWRLLLRMTVRKAVDKLRHENRAKRGGGKVHEVGAEDDYDLIDTIVGKEPTPEMAAIFNEQLDLLLRRLEDEELQRIAIAKLEGYKNEEIVEELGCSLSP